MFHAMPLKLRPCALSLSLLLATAGLPSLAQMSMGSQDGMEGMEGMDAETPKAPVAKKAPAKPLPAAQRAMPQAAHPEPMKPVQGMAMTPTPEARKPAAAGTMEVTPATPAQPAMEGMSMGATTEPGRGSEGLEGMAEPPPSSLNGRLILILFAVLNAGIIAIAAVMKLRRDNPKTPSEVKA